MSPKIWYDMRDFDDGERAVALYCLTSDQTNRIGYFNFSPGKAAEELGTLPPTFRQRLAKVCETFGWRYDPTFRVLLIPTWWEYQLPDNPNVLIGNCEDLHEVPVGVLEDEFQQALKALPQALYDAVVKRLGKRLGKRLAQRHANVAPQEQEQEQEQEQDHKGEGEPQPQAVVEEAWNAVAERFGLPKIKAWSTGRLRHLRARWAEPAWRELWQEALGKIGRSAFLTGGKPGRDGRSPFVADIDFFLRPDTVAKIVEGKYGDNADEPPPLDPAYVDHLESLSDQPATA